MMTSVSTLRFWLRLAFPALAALLLACSPTPPDPPSEEPPGPEETASISAVEASVRDNRPEVITIAADPWCPHNCEAGSDQEGYMIDIARTVFEAQGLSVEYVNTSWARALELVRKGELDAVVGAYHEDAPDFIFPQRAQGVAINRFYVRPDDNWTFNGLGSLQNRVLVGINNYSYTSAIDTYIRANRQNPDRIWILSGPSPLDRAIQLVDQKRADMLIEERAVFEHQLDTHPELPDLRPAGSLPRTLAYVAFSPALERSREHARLLSEGTQQLRQSGELEKILSRYGVRDW